MHTIHISDKNAVGKAVQVVGYIHPNSNHNTLMLCGLSLKDIVALRDYQAFHGIANSVLSIDLNKFNFSII